LECIRERGVVGLDNVDEQGSSQKSILDSVSRVERSKHIGLAVGIVQQNVKQIRNFQIGCSIEWEQSNRGQASTSA
jgi:hypothetical protein